MKKIKKFIQSILVTIASFMTLTPIVLAPTGGTAGVTGSVTIEQTCGLTATGPLNFGATTTGTVIPADSGASTVSTDVTNTGSVSTTDLTIEGTEWKIGGTTSSSPVPFVVESTHYSETATDPYTNASPPTMTALTSSGVSAFGGTLGNGVTDTLYFRVKPPFGVDAGSYSQTITFTSTC